MLLRGLGSRNSVYPPVRLSVCHTRALWQNQTMHCIYVDTTRKGNQSSLLTLTVVGGRHPLRLKFATKVTHPATPRKTPTLTDFRL